MHSVWREKGTTNLEFFKTQDFFLDCGAQLVDLVSYPKLCFGVVRLANSKQHAVIIEHSWDPRPHAYYNYSFAISSEGDFSGCSLQPLWYRCPEKILDQLSRAQEVFDGSALESALAWRQGCLELRQAIESRPKPKPGQRILFDRPIVFSDGEELGEFIYAGRNRFQHPFIPNWACRIPYWRERGYQIIQEDPEPGSALERLLG